MKLLDAFLRDNLIKTKKMVSGNKKSKSNLAAASPKATNQTIAQNQSVSSHGKLQISKPTISLKICQANLEEHVKKQIEIIE